MDLSRSGLIPSGGNKGYGLGGAKTSARRALHLLTDLPAPGLSRDPGVHDRPKIGDEPSGSVCQNRSLALFLPYRAAPFPW